MYLTYRLFNKLFRPQQHQKEQAEFVANLQISKDMLAGALPMWNHRTYPSHYGQTLLSELFQEKDECARFELKQFLAEFLELDINQVRGIYEKIGRAPTSGIDINLLRETLVKYVSLAITGKERKISMLLQQGVELSASERSYYIQRDISETMRGAGSAGRSPEEHQVFTLASYLLLKHLIETMVQHSVGLGAVWLKETAWYYACVFGFWMQYCADKNIVGKYYDLYMSGIKPSFENGNS